MKFNLVNFKCLSSLYVKVVAFVSYSTLSKIVLTRVKIVRRFQLEMKHYTKYTSEPSKNYKKFQLGKK